MSHIAKLTEQQLKLKVEREKKKNEAIQKKMEIQKKKELFGENWKTGEQTQLQKELEIEIGSEKSPKIYDSVDLYKFFDPIQMYKDPANKVLKMDLKQFTENEELYSKAIADLDEELDKLRKEDKDKEDNTEESETSNEDILKEDGTTAEDELMPISEEGDELAKAKKETPTAQAKGKLLRTASTYLNRFVPMYNRHVCTCCGMPKDVKDFYIVYNLTCVDRLDKRGNVHLHLCKECCNKLFMYYYSILCKHNVEDAMLKLCASLNLYFDTDTLAIARQKFEESGRKGTLVGAYIKEINSQASGLCFMDSPFLDERYLETRQTAPASIDTTPLEWSQQDAKNKKDVIHLLGYDPFSYEQNEDDKKILYADLVSIIDEDIQQDYVKLQSAVTIVKSFTKVRKLDEKLNLMEQNNAPLVDQKAVADLKAKELKAISDFSRDSGFSERFKTRQSQGETSFTGIIKKMDEKKYESELINKYDIATSSTIQAAADASFKAIFNQLNLSEAEAFKLAADQLAELRKIKQENDKLQEDLRLARYEAAELRLKEKAREKGVNIDE